MPGHFNTFFESQAWINRAIAIHKHLHNDCDSYTDLFCSNLKMDLQRVIYLVILFIYLVTLL